MSKKQQTEDEKYIELKRQYRAKTLEKASAIMQQIEEDEATEIINILMDSFGINVEILNR